MGPVNVRVFTLLPFILTLITAVAGAQERPRVIINVRGDVVEYDRELNSIAVQGQVQITARTDAPGYPSVSMTAEQVEGDLQSGLLVAHGGIKLLSQQFALRGEQVQINVKTDEFVMENGAASAEMPSVQYPGSVVRGYFMGDRICREAEVIIIVEGRVTTCDRRDPHYSIGARKIIFNTETGMLTLDRANLSLYGVRLTIPGRYTFPVIGDGSSDGFTMPLPQYSSYDGLYFRFERQLTWPGSPWAASAFVNIGTGLKFPAGVQLTNAGENDVFALNLTYREQRYFDFTRYSRINRLPELTYVHHLLPESRQSPQLDLEAFAGHIYERFEDEPTTEASRAGVALRYSPQPQNRRLGTGTWWGADLEQTFYDTGDHLTNLRLEAGIGGEISDRLDGSLRLVHNEHSGRSPFLFDDIFVDTYADATLDMQVDENNRVGVLGRYDFEENEFRDYGLRLAHRSHCLTWKLQYNIRRQEVQVGLDINGLTGGTRPPDTEPLVRPEEVPPLPESVSAPAPAPAAAPQPETTP